MTNKTPVIIDTDPGVDDIISILLALASPELKILAFIVTFGNTERDACYNNILKTYQAVNRHLEAHPHDRSRFPNFHQECKAILARGADGPLEGSVYSAMYFHGRDGLSDISTRHPELDLESDDVKDHPQLQLTNKPGAEVVIDLIQSYPPRTITYIALGPLTTLAHVAIQNTRLLQDRIGRVVCMGGALDVPGNVTPVAEFNFYADPFAVRHLLLPSEDGETCLPLDRFLLLSLDITTDHELSFPLYQKLVDPSFSSSLQPSMPSDKAPLHHFTSSFLEQTREVMIQFGKDGMELHDIVAVWCAIENPPNTSLNDGWVVAKRKFDIERMGELTRGMLVIDRRFDTTAYAPGANRSEVQAELDKRGIPHGIWESTALPAPVEVDHPEDAIIIGSGVPCVTGTPGCMVLLKILLKRNTMTRGRKKDPTIPPTRALIQQRDYRARRAHYVASLEEKCRKVEEENIQLREELAAVRVSRSTPPNHEVVEASIQLMHHLSSAVASLARFQQVAFPEHASNASASAIPRPPNTSTWSQSTEAENETHDPYQASAFSDTEDTPQIYSRAGSSECCGGFLDCRDLVETNCHEHEPLTRTSGLRSTSSAGKDSV
ncbi:hypothetical protein APHAL10511_000126 [Amanita phalloides]|nr:hypothetical protein APHAL10511_000126 [Amanita phalloides]